MSVMVTLQQLLDAKEKRQYTRRLLLKTFGATLICFNVNYAGFVKKDQYSFAVFNAGVQAVLAEFDKEVLYQTSNFFDTGYEAFFVVDCLAKTAKQRCCEIESTQLGRLFDLDVFDKDETQINRVDVGLPQRKCLLCDCNAAECYALRRHDVEDIKSAINKLINDCLFANK